MKKSLFALAATTAIAGVAQAQSSVTVYGILDLGMVGATATLAPGGTSAVAKGTGLAFTGGAQSTNRLGFKGSEDLGGGVSAFFTIEQAITPNATSAISSGTTANRQTFVGLKKNGLGDFAIGTQYTPIHNAVAATDPGQANNIMGNVIYIAPTYPGAMATTPVGAASVTGGIANLDNNIAYTVRSANALTFNSANVGGFQAHAIAILNNSNSNQTRAVYTTSTSGNVTGGVNNNNGWGLGLDYTWNKLFLTANYQALSSTNPYDLANTYALNNTGSGATKTVASTSGVPSIWGLAGTNASGTNVRDNQAYVAGTYDFGILKAYGQFVSRKASSQLDSNMYVKRSSQQIGVRSYITPTIEAWASGGNGSFVAYGASNPTARFTAFQLGSNYWLSKRTNLYAIYGQQATSNVAVTATTGYASTNSNNYAVGLRHTF